MSLVFQEVDSIRRRRRVIQFSVIVTLTFGALFYRLIDLQLAQGEAFQKRAIKNFVRREHIEAKRGSILDSQGRPLAIHEPTYTLSIRPSKVEHLDDLLIALSQNLKLSEVSSGKIR